MIDNTLHDELNKLGKSGIIDGLFRTVAFGLSFAINIVIARLVGASPIGIVAVLISLLTIASIIPSFGLNLGILRIVPEQISKKNYADIHWTIQGTYVLVLFNSLMLILFYWMFRSSIIGLPFFQAIHNYFLIDAAILLLPFVAFTAINQSLFTSIQRNYYSTIYDQIVKNVLKVAALVFFISLFSNDVALLFATATGIVIAFIVEITIIVRYFKKHYSVRLLLGNINIQAIRKVFLFSYSLVLIPFMTSSSREIDLWISSAYLSSKEIGVYSIIRTIGAVIIFPLAMFGEIFVISALKLQRLSNEGDANKLFMISVKWIFICSSFIFCVLYAFSDMILSLFGSDFMAGATILKIFCAGQMVVCSFGAPGTVLLMIDKKNILIFNSFLSLLFTIFTSIYFVRHFGLLGAAFSFLLTAVMAQLLVVYQVKRYSIYRPGTGGQYIKRTLLIIINLLLQEALLVILPVTLSFLRVALQILCLLAGYVLYIFVIERSDPVEDIIRKY